MTTTINVAVGESTDKPPADRVVGNRCPSPRGSEQRSKYLVTDLLARIKLITNSLATGKRRSQAPHLSIAQHIHTDAEDKKKPLNVRNYGIGPEQLVVFGTIPIL